MIRLEGVTKIFADRTKSQPTVALENMDLIINPEEFVCLVGPSGCGKSTVLNLIAGLELPTHGRVLLGERPILRPGPDRGVVFQEATLFPWLSVLDNITFGPRMNGMARAECLSAAERYIALMGLQGFERHRPYELSGGMKQRVAIARAWIMGPQVLLMDEPFGALDAQTRLLMQEHLLGAWESSRTTVLFITHDLDEAILLGDRVCLMTARPGRVKTEIKIPFSRPRDLEALVVSQEFGEIKRRVLHVIKEETLRAFRLGSGA